ncbi:MAG TPA: ABC transporter permease, partial [Candidatus Angelobacter sp.]
MHAFLQDLRYAGRQLLKSPGFAVLAVLTLALGIGANAAMFTAVESVLLRPLRYANPGRLISIGPAGVEGFGSTSWLNYRDVRDQAQTLQSAAGYSEDVGVVQGKDGSISVVTPGVTPNVFSTLGARPLLGRTFTEEEGQKGGPQAVVLSEGLWRQQFGADPAIIGKSVRVNAQARTVVGVMPGSFRFPETMGQDMGKGLWLPLQPNQSMLTERGYHFFYILAAMKPGVTVAQVNSELGTITNRIRQIDPENSRDLAFRAASYQGLLTGSIRPVFIALMIALGLVLLIGCANVTNLLIARCLGRQQEFAVRAALGASRGRLLQQLIVEGGLLSVLGCAAGLALANFAIDLVRKLPPDTFPRAEDIAIRWTMVAVLAVIATLTTILS